MSTTKEPFEPGVYLSKDICKLFQVGINEIPRAIESGLIPKPIATTEKGQTRRWSKAAVDSALGLNLTDNIMLRSIIREELATVLGEASERSKPHIFFESPEEAGAPTRV